MRGTILRNIALLFFSLVACTHAVAGGYGEQGRLEREWYEQINGASGGPAEKLAKAYVAMLQGQESKTAQEDGCGCAIDTSGRILDPLKCEPVFSARREDLAKVVAVEIVPPASWAVALPCFSQGAPSCRNSKGIQLVGETCCEWSDRGYTKVKSDANLYVLMAAPLAEQVAGLSFGPTPQGKRVLPACRIEVDRAARTWSFGPGSNGFWARSWLYAARHYGAKVPEPVGALLRLSSERPPSAGEIARSRAIGQVQNGRVQDVTLEFEGQRK